jgi:metal-dependent amidase/aminoacylase/carboxypeptidase family protein
VERLERVAAKAGIPLEYKEGPFRWSEDFGRYLAMFPGAMFGIGSGEDQPELHHPEYDFPDQLIGPATQFVTTVISDFCENTTMVDQ